MLKNQLEVPADQETRCRLEDALGVAPDQQVGDDQSGIVPRCCQIRPVLLRGTEKHHRAYYY